MLLAADCLVELAAGVSLEDKLKLLEPQWRAKFCLGASGAQAGAGNLQSIHPKGTPTLLLVSPAALGAIKLIKHCPAFHKVCALARVMMSEECMCSCNSLVLINCARVLFLPYCTSLYIFLFLIVHYFSMMKIRASLICGCACGIPQLRSSTETMALAHLPQI